MELLKNYNNELGDYMSAQYDEGLSCRISFV